MMRLPPHPEPQRLVASTVAPLAVLAALVAGCSGSPEDAPEPKPGSGTTSDPTVTFESPVPTVATVRWAGGGGHVTYTEVGDDVVRASPSGTGEVQLLGLAAGAAYTGELVRDDGTGVALSFEVPAVPGRPPFTVTDVDAARSEVDDGYVLMALVSATQAWALQIDGQGRTSWSLEIPTEDIVIAARPGLDGESLLYAQLERQREIDRGEIHRVALDGTPVASTRAVWIHHTFVELTDGTFGWMGHDFRDITHNGVTWPVFTDTILETGEGATDTSTTVEVFNFFDDYEDFFVPCEHVLYAETRFGMEGLHEWTHANSLMLSEDEGRWFIAPRLHDSLIAVDRATGVIEWQLGGPFNAFTPLTDDESTFWWSHGHLSQVWDGGFVMFDNGSHKDPPVSSVAEYRFDEDAMTVEKVWEHVDPEGRFAPFLGDIRKLPGGNYLVSWSPFSEITEITPEGDVVWRARAETGAIMGRVRFVTDPYAPQVE